MGRWGEELAEQTLVEAGMVILDRNWRCELGEIDLVARDGDTVVICEVKARSSCAVGHPFDAVTARKVTRLRRLAARWLAEHAVRPTGVRLDVVGILTSGPASGGGQVQIEHLRGVG